MTEPSLAAPVGKGPSLGGLFAIIVFLVAVLALTAVLSGCAYRGGKVTDGTNLAIGITVPGTEWTINVLDYVGGVRVCGNDMTSITVTNEVVETNRYFGVVETNRRTKMTAVIEPCETTATNSLREAESGDR